MERLFVYGTLAPGRPNHGVLGGIPGNWEAASLKGNLLGEGWGTEFGCPGIMPSDEGEEVEGFVFSSDHLSEHWSMLDEYEGTGYKRVAVLVKTESGQKLKPMFMRSTMSPNKRMQLDAQTVTRFARH